MWSCAGTVEVHEHWIAHVVAVTSDSAPKGPSTAAPPHRYSPAGLNTVALSLLAMPRASDLNTSAHPPWAVVRVAMP